jgi:hypothetical protein
MAQRAGDVGPLEDAELLDVEVGVAAGGELEVATEQCAAGGEEFFGGLGHGGTIVG